jgi:hypothetical protein
MAQASRSALALLAMRRMRRAAQRLAGAKFSRWQSRPFRAHRLLDPLRQALARRRASGARRARAKTTRQWWKSAMTTSENTDTTSPGARRMRRYRERRRRGVSCVISNCSKQKSRRSFNGDYWNRRSGTIRPPSHAQWACFSTVIRLHDGDSDVQHQAQHRTVTCHKETRQPMTVCPISACKMLSSHK